MSETHTGFEMDPAQLVPARRNYADESSFRRNYADETTRTKLRGRIVISPKLRGRINLICTGVSNLGN